MYEEFESTVPCPICGNKNVAYSDMLRIAYTDNIDGDTYNRLGSEFIVICEGKSLGVAVGCRARTPVFPTKERAREYWEDPSYIKTTEVDTTIGGFDAASV